MMEVFLLDYFFYIRFGILFWPFTWFDWFWNSFFNCDERVWRFLYFILARNTWLIWSYTWYTILKSSLLISRSDGFSILVLRPDKLVDDIEPDLFSLLTVFYASVFWVELDLFNDLRLSDLLLLDVSTILLDACDLSVLLTVSILLF